MEREAFLARVRAKLAGVGNPGLPASWPPTPAGGSAVDPARFLRELETRRGRGVLVAPADLPGAVAAAVLELAAPAGGDPPTAVLAADLGPFDGAVEEGLRSAGWETRRPAGAAGWRAEAAVAGLGVTSAALGSCATGSILLAPGPDAPRVASLLPPAHLVVLPADRLVPGMDEAVAAAGRLAGSSSAPVLVSGPSRTSDIEMNTVYGVHGPRTLTVLLVGEAPGG